MWRTEADLEHFSDWVAATRGHWEARSETSGGCARSLGNLGGHGLLAWVGLEGPGVHGKACPWVVSLLVVGGLVLDRCPPAVMTSLLLDLGAMALGPLRWCRTYFIHHPLYIIYSSFIHLPYKGPNVSKVVEGGQGVACACSLT